MLLVCPKRFEDERGFFSETYSKSALAAHGVDVEFIQDNHSLSRLKGVVRGLHFQIPPFAQDKLVRCSRGSILDVAVDIREGSPTYGRHVAVVLSAANWRQLFVPSGFAHGFCTLEADTEVLYKVSAGYSREHEQGVAWDDPALGIEWPVGTGEAVLSDKDANNPPLSALAACFAYRSDAER